MKLLCATLFLAVISSLNWVHGAAQRPCYGYITGRGSFLNNSAAAPIQCGDSVFGDAWGPSEHQELSCCSGDGRYFVQTGQMGGFDATFSGNADFFSEFHSTCNAYTDALQAILCDPRQGDFISNNVLRVCRSSCDAVFEACGSPGEIFPEWANYEDGSSLCMAMWGGFGVSDPCQGRSEGFPCQAGLSIEVLDSDCLSFIEPSNKVLKHYVKEQFAPNPCDDKSGVNLSVGAIVGIAVGSLCALGLVGTILLWLKRRRPSNSKSEGTVPDVKVSAWAEAVYVDEETAPGVSMDKVPSQPAVAIPVSVEAFENAKPVPAPYPTAPVAEPEEINATPADLVALEESREEPSPAMQLIDTVKKAATYEKSDAIQNWMQSHPGQAALLTPDEAAEVLSLVTFSLDQTSAAATISSGMGNSITCKHVATMLGRCQSTTKADIAKTLVVHVNDPENREMVLTEIDSSFGRDEVANKFPKSG